MALPLAGVALRAGGKVAGRLAGKALRWATKGKLLGAGGGKAIAKKVAIGGVTAATIFPGTVAKGAKRAFGFDGDKGEGRTYRRMNPMNARALRRAVRRLESAEKLFKKVYRFNHAKSAVNVRPKGR